MKHGLIILHYKNSLMTNRCLSSVLQGARENDVVYIVDNSHDYQNTLDAKLTVVLPEVINPGFARGMNIGAKKATEDGCDILVFINNDTILPTQFCADIDNIFGEANGPIAAVGPKIVYLDHSDVIWSAGGNVSRVLMKSTQSMYNKSAAALKGISETDFLSGCVICVKASCFREVGGWADAYFFGGEEWELSMRLQQLGYKLIVAGDVVVKHEASMVEGQGASHNFTDLRFVLNSYLNRLIFATRNFGKLEALAFRLRVSLYLLLILPLRWKHVGGSQDYLYKLRVASEIVLRILRRDGNQPVTIEELTTFQRAIENKL